VVKLTNGYVPMFVLACSAYLLALLIIQLLAPKLLPANVS
jgi:MFS transporter, ACS family, hexuronate transporter